MNAEMPAGPEMDALVAKRVMGIDPNQICDGEWECEPWPGHCVRCGSLARRRWLRKFSRRINPSCSSSAVLKRSKSALSVGRTELERPPPSSPTAGRRWRLRVRKGRKSEDRHAKRLLHIFQLLLRVEQTRIGILSAACFSYRIDPLRIVAAV